MTHSPETAEELTLDVFHDIWRHAARFDAAQGTVLAWIMNQARSRAIEFRQQGRWLREASTVLTPHERHAIEAAFFSGLTYAEVAVRLNQPLGTIKTRIRSALQKLRQALAAEGRSS